MEEPLDDMLAQEDERRGRVWQEMRERLACFKREGPLGTHTVSVKDQRQEFHRSRRHSAEGKATSGQ